jgi:Uma2 family endonuclease
MLTKINLSSLGMAVNSQFELICQQNPQLKLELTPTGELIVMSPTGGLTGKLNARLNSRFVVWNESKTPEWGIVFDSSTCFRLPNGALRSPDVAWLSLSRWDSLTREQQEGFPPLAPDFVLELLNPQKQEVEIYRLGEAKQVLFNPSSLSGEEVLPGFVLDLLGVWLSY